MDEAIANFTGITGASEDVARQVLEMCAGDDEQAVMLWFNDEELQRSLTNPARSAATAATGSSSARSRPSNRQLSGANRQTAIPIDDSDDDMEEDDVPDLGDDDDDDAAQAARTARLAQEEEDAAFARQMQEQLYGSGGAAGAAVDEEGVRAPMGRTTETLVAPSGAPGDEDDGAFLAFQQAQLQRRMASMRPNMPNNPFAQNIWDNNGAPGRSSNVPAARESTSRASHLAELFAPPRDLIARLTFEEARDAGKEHKRWILVNLQNSSDFHCQALNRDIWKDEAIKALVSEHFIFLQYDKDHPTALEYIQFYFPDQSHERDETYPHVSIIDPRTGEQVKTWSGAPFATPLEFHAQLAEFLDRYSLEANSKNPVSKVKPLKPAKNFDRMTEEEMLEMALQESMGQNGSSASTPVVDPDALTKVPELSAQDKGKGLAGPEPVEDPSTTENAAFAAISSDQPHAEPDNNPATTTRIQFRHPDGRVIRRFNLSDPVVRIYEWLKAEPLAGKDGVEFELKVMPEGLDLITALDKTIAEVGLKNGTVMIEFL